MNQFGNYLRKLRQKRKLTLKKLADSLKVSIAYIHQIETGKCASPTATRCRQIAEIVGIDFDELWRRVSAARIEQKFSDAQDERPVVLTHGEKKILKIFRALDGDGKREFLDNLEKTVDGLKNDYNVVVSAELLEKFEEEIQ